MALTPLDNLRVVPHGATGPEELLDGLPPLMQAFADAGIDVTVIAAPAMLEEPVGHHPGVEHPQRALGRRVRRGHGAGGERGSLPARAGRGDTVRRGRGRRQGLTGRPSWIGLGRPIRRARSRRAGARQDGWSRARPPRGEPVPAVAARAAVDGDPPGVEASDAVSAEPVDAARQGVLGEVVPATGVWWAAAGLALLVTTAVAAQLGVDNLGVVSVPLAGVLLAVAASRRIARRRPDEAWVGRWLVLGVVAKLTASYLRYVTLVVSYEGVGDATGYDGFGRQFAAAWLGDGSAPVLPDLRRTNFVRWFTGVVYYLFGSNMVLGFFVFGLLALVGSYLWYRATVEAVPDRRQAPVPRARPLRARASPSGRRRSARSR